MIFRLVIMKNLLLVVLGLLIYGCVKSHNFLFIFRWSFCWRQKGSYKMQEPSSKFTFLHKKLLSVLIFHILRIPSKPQQHNLKSRLTVVGFHENDFKCPTLPNHHHHHPGEINPPQSILEFLGYLHQNMVTIT